ncbi:MAG: ribokinase [Actinomycetota bacterium]
MQKAFDTPENPHRASRIAVLGSANMDLVVTVDRAPNRGETVTGRTFHTVPGGKGANQALAAARAGGSVAFLGAVGDDAHGAQIRSLLIADGVDVRGLQTSEVPTGTAHIVVDEDGGNAIVVVPGANGTVTALTDAHRLAIEAADALLLQLEVPLSVVIEAAEFARSKGVRTVLTPAPVVDLPADLLDAIDVIVPNEHEAARLWDLSGRTSPRAAAERVSGLTGDVLVTRGATGSAWYGRDGTVVAVPAFPVEALDTTAAGDTYVGAFAVAWVSGMAVEPAMRWASAAAALAVQRLGASASMPYRAEIEKFLECATP